MAVSWIFLIAAWSVLACASRLKYIPGLGTPLHPAIGPMGQQSPWTHAPVHLPSLQMQMPVAPTRDDDLAFFWTNASGPVVPGRGWKSKIKYGGKWSWSSGRQISRQQFPPTSIYEVDTRRLINKWESSVADSLKERVGAIASTSIASLRKTHVWQRVQAVSGLPTQTQTLKDRQRDKATVLRNMHDAIAEMAHMRERPDLLRQEVASGVSAGPSRLDRLRSIRLPFTTTTKVEMVGLIPKDFEASWSERGSPEVEASVSALGVFSREKVNDDARGSLRNKVQEQYGKSWTRRWWGPEKKQLGVFAIQGLAPGPSLTEVSAELLLSKIVKYAYKEQKIVMVPKQAYNNRFEADLTEYYVRLGFEKVEMEYKTYELIYTGTPLCLKTSVGRADDNEDQQIMVDIDLWTGI